VSSAEDLERILHRIDGSGYRAYKELRGSYRFPELELFVDHVQGDPFAAPSKLRVRVPMSIAQLPEPLHATKVRRIALQDFLAREIRDAIRARGRHAGAADAELGAAPERARSRRGEPRGSGKSGQITIDAGGQEVLERTAVLVDAAWAEARLEVGLPAAGRRILGREAALLLTRAVPEACLAGLSWPRLCTTGADQRAQRFVECIENQEHIREQLAAHGLVAFVANGSLLPRASGASDRPLAGERAVPFESPASLRVELRVPNPVDDAGTCTIAGMGIPRGINLIVGGGYHGKSTLLKALERAVHPHVPGDGREGVVAAPGLVKIRAEDGRRVERVDIHAFIDSLPRDRSGEARSTRCFSSDDASGSTSQAANIIEALEAGATGLLLDEDTSATNFMVRDARMQALVAAEHEPITPFLDRVRELYESHDVSTVLVMGGCGDYFDVADRVIAMRDYRPFDVTEEARAIAREQQSERIAEPRSPLGAIAPRVPEAASFDAARGRREVKIDAIECDRIRYGRDLIELRWVEQIVDWSQTRAIGLAILLATRRFMEPDATLTSVLDRIDALFDEEGLDALDPFRRPGTAAHPGCLARPRRFEIAAAINRLRSLRIGGA
jgi:predicted ABC-class ATPase